MVYIRKDKVIIIYLNFMRSNPPFDPRMQPVGMYINNGPQIPQMYIQPMMPQPMPPHQNFVQMPVVTQTYPNQEYAVIGTRPQPPPQYVGQQVRVQRQENVGASESTQPTKPGSVLPSHAQQQHQNNVQNQQQQNENSQQGQYQQGNQGDEQQEIKNQQIIMFWEHKFYTILERFQLIFEKVEWIRSEFYNLNNQLKAVDSEEEWNQAKDHHEDFMEQLQQFSQQLAGIINQNANLVQQNQAEGNQHNVWKQRYFQLFEGYKAMEQQLFEIKETKPVSENQDLKVAQLMANYRDLQRQYSQTMNQLSELKQNANKSQDGNNDKSYKQKLDYALRQTENYKQTLDHLNKQNQEMASIIEEYKAEKAHLQAIIEQESKKNMQFNFQQFQRAVAERDDEIVVLNQQIKNLTEKYNFLVQAHNSLQVRLQDESKIKLKLNDIQQQLNSKNIEVAEHKAKLHQSQLKLKSVTSISDEYQKLLKTRSTQIQERAEQVQKLKRQINNLVSLANSRRVEPEREPTITRKQHQLKIKRIEQQYEQKLDGLKKKLRKKEEQGENTALLIIKIQSLQKKNKMLLVQIQNLNKDLSSKQKQSLQFKRIGGNQEKLKQLQYQYNLAVEQRQKINATLIQRNYEVDSLQSQVNDYQTRIKSLSENNYTNNSKSLISEIEELNKLIQGKQGEINKLKSTLNLKEGHIRQLESQVQKSKATINSNEKLHTREKDALSQSIRAAQRRNQQNEKKMRDLQFDYGSVMKRNLEQEIRNLRAQNQQRQQNIIRLEADELQLRSRLSHFERIRATHNFDVEQLANRIKQLETSKYDMIKKVETSFRDFKNKQRQNRQLIDQTKSLKQNIVKFQNQINQNEKLISQKQKIIENLQGQLLVTNQRLAYVTQEHDSLRLRRRDETDILTKQSDDLKRKIFEYEHLNGSKKQFKEKFSSQITKIQNQAIQQLKEQKQFLKSELSAALEQLGQLPVFDKKIGSSRKSKASQGIDFIQKRLFDFNSKLDQIIVKNKQLNSRGFGSNIQNANTNSKSRAQNRDSQQQIKALKSQIQELRKYISKLEVESAGETIKYNPKNQIIYQEQEKAHNERIDFYQKQSNQLQSRIQHLIKVNSSLKQRLDSLLKDGGSGSSANFYKSQLAISQQNIENLQSKITKLMNENRALKANTNDSTTKMCRGYEDKLFECQNKIFSLQRKITSLQLQKNRSQNERAGLQRNLNLVQNQLLTIKSSTEKQIKTQQSNNKELNDQVRNFENEIGDLLQKVRILQSENSRLSQAVHTSYSQQHILLNTPMKDTPKPTYKR